jgi:hypothetical protein
MSRPLSEPNLQGSSQNGKSEQIKPRSEGPDEVSRHEPMLTAETGRVPK